jgi:predicted Zn-dependent protease
MVKHSVVWLIALLALAACTPRPTYPPHPSSRSGQNGTVTTLATINSYGEDAARLLIQNHGGLFRDETVEAYLQAVVRSLATLNGNPSRGWQVWVVNDPACELLSVPGRTLLVYRGFLTRVGSQRELAAVLGHEMAHLTLDHLAQTASGDRAVVDGQSLADFIVHYHYGVEQERQAGNLWRQQVGAAGHTDVLTEGLSHGGWIDRHPNGIDGVFPELRLPTEEPAAPSFDDMRAVLATLSPGYALFEQGLQLERQEHFLKAIAVYLQAATQAPDQSQILTGLGLAYLKVGERNSARHHLQRAVRLDGGYYRSHLGLGYVSLQLGDLERAEKELGESLALLPTVQGRYLLADVYRSQEDWRRAVPLFRQVMDAEPHSTLGKAARQAIDEQPRP